MFYLWGELMTRMDEEVKKPKEAIRVHFLQLRTIYTSTANECGESACRKYILRGYEFTALFLFSFH
jgi:hypothetical protein